MAALQTRADMAGLITWEVSVDSTINRAHQHAAGARTDGELQRELPPVASPVTGEVEARLIALACSQPPAGHPTWITPPSIGS